MLQYRGTKVIDVLGANFPGVVPRDAIREVPIVRGRIGTNCMAVSGTMGSAAKMVHQRSGDLLRIGTSFELALVRGGRVAPPDLVREESGGRTVLWTVFRGRS